MLRRCTGLVFACFAPQNRQKREGKPRFCPHFAVLRFCLCVWGFREKLTHRRPKLTKFPMPVARMAGLVFLLVFWVLAGACQRHGVGVFLLRNTTTTMPVARHENKKIPPCRRRVQKLSPPPPLPCGTFALPRTPAARPRNRPPCWFVWRRVWRGDWRGGASSRGEGARAAWLRENRGAPHAHAAAVLSRMLLKRLTMPLREPPCERG